MRFDSKVGYESRQRLCIAIARFRQKRNRRHAPAPNHLVTNKGTGASNDGSRELLDFREGLLLARTSLPGIASVLADQRNGGIERHRSSAFSAPDWMFNAAIVCPMGVSLASMASSEMVDGSDNRRTGSTFARSSFRLPTRHRDRRRSQSILLLIRKQTRPTISVATPTTTELVTHPRSPDRSPLNHLGRWETFLSLARYAIEHRHRSLRLLRQ